MAQFSPYQLVLSRRIADSGAWRPEIVYDLHLPPTSIEYGPRAAHQVTPLFGGVHVESGPSFLGDLTVQLEHGVGFALSSDAQGNPAVLTGLERERALRGFMASANAMLAAGGWRMEFHGEVRDLHVQVVPVPQGQRHQINATDKTRVGGANVSLSFTIVGDLSGPVRVLGGIVDEIRGAQAAMGRVAGAVAGAITLVNEIVSLPGQFAGLITTARRQNEVVAAAFDALATSTSRAHELPQQAITDLHALHDSIVDGFIAIGRYGDAELFRNLDDQLVQGEAIALQMIQKELVGSAGQAGAGSQAGQAFSMLANLDDYQGWVPYQAQAGESLADLAATAMGSADLWPVLAAANGLSSPWLDDLDCVAALKIPVHAGGVPWGVAAFADPAALRQALTEWIYKRDFMLVEGEDGRADFAVDEDDPRDVLTITGLPNYCQRYRVLGLKTELGENPTFRDFGVYQGTGEPNLQPTGLTRESVRALLWSDPRTVGVQVLVDQTTADSATVEFAVQTRDSSARFAL